ncbi:hypothetical protein THIOM_004547 [Candidatus Thiomargarita nelsonii]|uniref:DUF1534 domain-containing protein n=1 Tax=Candidatus Thiomargarita nelsonii TaxID=1003181 RepID=A0A176RVP6_9GAMM|nr:hypothetical protein THIOM_004547 [Candidatus Thiomargarita nelsonii]
MPRRYRSISEASIYRSHALRGNACLDALRRAGRGASMKAFPRRAWEREIPHSYNALKFRKPQ